jgi:Holliday junction resolvase RusA-like endonuclease
VILFVRVYGRPAPEGSHEIGQHGYVMHSSKYLKAWRAAVNRDTRRAYVEAGLTGADMPLVPYPRPVYLHSIELLVGPEQCRADGTDEPTGSPDLDKLLRATIDGLGEARAFGNDSQVTRIYELGKRRDPEPGAVIIISDQPIRGENDVTEYLISLQRVTGRDESGLRDYESVFELHGDEQTVKTAGLSTLGALLGFKGVRIEAGEAAAAAEAPAAEPEPVPAKTRKPRATKAAPATEPEVKAEHVEQEREAARGDEVAPPADIVTALAAPVAGAAPFNPFLNKA